MTDSTTDADLLAAFLHDGNPDAFAALARRHAAFVHAAARRLAPHDADDITQSVFLLLAQKKPRLTEKTLLPWLHTTTRYAALNAGKLRRRRQHHEHRAGAAMPQHTFPDEPLDDHTAHQTRALLDHALAKLPGDQRAALLLRHLEGKSLDETAAALKISPAAASKRTSRALEKLRAFLTRRGVPLSAAALAALLAAESAHAAPPALLASLTAPTASATALAHLTAKSLLGAKMKLAALLSSTTAAAALAAWALSAALAQSPPATAPAVAATAPATGDLLLASYTLVVDAPTADRLRALSKISPGTSDFYELRTAHADDLRTILRGNTLATGSVSTHLLPETPPPHPAPDAHNWTWQSFYAETIRRNNATALVAADFGSPIGWESKNTVDFHDNALHLAVNFDNQRVWQRIYGINAANSTTNTEIPELQRNASIHWAADLSAGDAFLALGPVNQLPNSPLTIVAICETFRAPPEEAERLCTVFDTARWISDGPAHLLQQADTALVWAYASRPAREQARAIRKQWTRTLPDGTTVTLDSIGAILPDARNSPFLWWDPAGNAVVSNRFNSIPPDKLALHIIVQSPNALSGRVDVPIDDRLYLDNTFPAPRTATRALLYVAEKTWSEKPIAVGDSLTLPAGDTVQFKKISPAGDNLTLAILKGHVAPQLQVSIAAVTKDGKRVLAHNTESDRTLLSLDDKSPAWTGDDANLSVKAADVDHWLLLTRPRRPALFENFATRPTVNPAEVATAPADIAAARRLAATDRTFAQGLRQADALDAIDELPRDPATPTGALRLLIDAANTGNPALVKPFLTGSNPRDIDATARMLALSGSLHCRLEKAYGRVQLAQAFSDLAHSISLEESFLHEPLKPQDDNTAATAGGNDRLVRTPATGNAWKLDVDALMPKNLPPAAINARLAQLQAASKIADAAESGKLTAPQAAALVIKSLDTNP